MKFYVHVARVMNKLFVRGYENGQRFQETIDYTPYTFETVNRNSNYKTLQGKPVIQLYHDSMSEAHAYIKGNRDVIGKTIYGIEAFEYQYINDEYPGEISYNPSLISVVTIDIETDSENGFPDIKTANKAITAITLRKDDKVITFGTLDYTPELSYVEYVKGKDEQDMLKKFLDTWCSDEWMPDIITGWNVEFFDMPYIINRLERLFGESVAKRLSPWKRWEKKLDYQFMSRNNDNKKEGDQDEMHYVRIPLGITILDYMQLYKKFTFAQQESFRLDHIAFMELGERKLDYTQLGFETLDQFYKNDYQNFINYNIRDVDLVYRIDQKMKLLEQVYAITYDAKVNYIDSLATVAMWDVIIHNYLLSKNIVIPLKKRGDKTRQIEGGYVKDPQNGMHKWVISFDLNSLYPHLIMQYNISPETFVGQLFEFDNMITKRSVDLFLEGVIDQKRSEEEKDKIVEILSGLPELYDVDKKHLENNKSYVKKYDSVRNVLDEHNVTICPTGCLFSKEVRGFLPTLMDNMYNDRTVWKKRMIEAKKAYEQNKTQELENEIARCHNMQLAKKIQLNSAYGALSNAFFRWFDNRLAESITKAGQFSIRWMESKINQYLNRVLNTNNIDYVLAIDTDSMYITFDRLVQKVFDGKEPSTDDIVSFLDKTCQKVIEPFIDKEYQNLANYVSAYDQKMKMKRESIAEKGIWTGKKHYILNVWDLEGVRYKEPKLKMQGIEAVRSSTPSACRSYIKESLDIIMNKTEPELWDYIAKKRKEFKSLSFEEVAFPRSVRGMIEKDIRDSNNKIIQKSYNTGTLQFMSGTPIHVKGSLMHNYLIKMKKLDRRYPLIGEGEKIKFCYVLDSAPIPTNVIAAPGKLPKELGLDKFLDKEMQFEKAFLEPLRTILNVINWKEQNDKNTLDSFFG
jgi:DNA polymerase elongation subunit (family B)